MREFSFVFRLYFEIINKMRFRKADYSKYQIQYHIVTNIVPMLKILIKKECIDLFYEKKKILG
jgi:hypothetical protein